MGERQKRLLKLLRGSKSGLSVDELSKGLEVTRNAMRDATAFCIPGIGRIGGCGEGRPQQLYILTELAKEMSPRQYSWLAQLVVALSSMKEASKKWASV